MLAQPPDLVLKLLRLALDPAAAPGEAENAAVAFCRQARSAGVRFQQLIADDPIDTEEAPAACRVPMPFGRYKGWTLGEIAEDNIGYVYWLYTQARLRGGLRHAVEVVWNYYS